MKNLIQILLGALFVGGTLTTGANAEPADEQHRFKFSLDGVTIVSADEDSKEGIQPDAPRLASTIDSKEALRIADGYLAKVFGENFKPKVAGVALLRSYSIRDSRHKWEWHVSYIDPKSKPDIRSSLLIRIVLSPSGEVLMRTASSQPQPKSD